MYYHFLSLGLLLPLLSPSQLSNKFTTRPESTSDDFLSPDFPIALRNRGPGSPALASSSKDHGHRSSSESLRRDYEFRIVKMQSRIANLERQVEDGEECARQLEQSNQRVRKLQDELGSCRRVCPFTHFSDTALNLV